MQSLILFNIGEDEMTVGELTHRGYYLGTNVTYKFKKLVESGYVAQERSVHDRRLVHVRLTEKGLSLCTKLHEAFERHARALAGGVLGPDDIAQANRAFERMSRFWGGGAFRFADTKAA
jgi:DNA-binding MarR family transcriptional regulator